MSSKLGSQAAYQAGMIGLFEKQFFHSIPEVPADISLSRQTALVTGSNCGLGLSAARQFLELGLSRLIMGVRSQERGDAAAAQLRADFPTATIEVWLVDYFSYRSVQNFAAKCVDELPRLDIAVLNAGIGKMRFERCEETGHEQSFQVNYLSTVLLAFLLLPKLSVNAREGGAGSPARLTMVVSDLALWTDMEETDKFGIIERLDTPKQPYSHLYQYGHAKLMLSMFASRLAREIQSRDVIVNVVNPSLVMGTEVFREWKMTWIEKACLHVFAAFFGRKLADGGRILVHASTVLGEESHGGFVDRIIRPYPPIMYTDRGHRLTEQTWEETLQELEFANVRDILKQLQN
ncbi:NAD(P)-binding protein [Thozetella sp. PMI_491]|nr:NAD(P)-binding protein [Thozetella sp. PMI_491]